MFQELIQVRQMNLKTNAYCPCQTGNQSATQAHLTAGFKLKLPLLEKTLHLMMSNTLRKSSNYKGKDNCGLHTEIFTENKATTVSYPIMHKTISHTFLPVTVE